MCVCVCDTMLHVPSNFMMVRVGLICLAVCVCVCVCDIMYMSLGEYGGNGSES